MSNPNSSTNKPAKNLEEKPAKKISYLLVIGIVFIVFLELIEHIPEKNPSDSLHALHLFLTTMIPLYPYSVLFIGLFSSVIFKKFSEFLKRFARLPK